MDSAALELLKASKIIIDERYREQRIEDLFTPVFIESIREAASTIEELARPADDDYHNQLINHYLTIRRFLPKLLESVIFSATENGQKILDAIQFLKSIEGKSKPKLNNAPCDMIPKSWRRHVFDQDRNISRRAYTLYALKCLQENLRRRDIYVDASDKWNDPRSKLLNGDQWKSVKVNVSRTLGRDEFAKSELKKLTHQLDEAYKRTAINLPGNSHVRIESDNGKDSLTVENLEEPQSLVSLRNTVSSLLPKVDLPEILMENSPSDWVCQ